MKKILFALGMLAFAVSVLPQAKGADISLDFIYDNLSGGNWIDVEGYGYGWQPDVAQSDPNWRPYADGYWAYTDYGWTWISYEDFGWATYHYGRWARLADYGWVWLPGSNLDWGPAWVSWRTGGDNIGWAPLPPRGPEVVYEGQPIGARVDIEYDIGPEYYNFCDVRFIGEPVLRDRIYPPTQNVTYITTTVNVTNIYVQNNTVYNYGPDYNVVSAYSTRPIQRLTVQRESAADLSAAVKSGALTKVQGNKLVLAAPQKIVKASASVKPPTVKAKVAQPKIERGWTGVQNKAELEQKIKNQDPKKIPPPSRQPARPVASAAPAGGGTPIAVGSGTPAALGGRTPTPPTPRGGKPGRPGTSVTPAGISATPAERGKPTPPRGKLGATTTPARSTLSASPFEGAKSTPAGRPTLPERAAGISPTPFERGKPSRGARPRPGATEAPAGARGGLSATPFERGGRPSRRAATPPTSSLRASPPPERGARPTRTLGESPVPGGGQENISPQGRGRTPERQRFGTPAPLGGAANEQRGGEQRTSPNLRNPGNPLPSGAAAGESRGARERGPGAVNQPGGPPRGGVPAAAAEQNAPQPAGGKKKPERGTPPPRP